MFYLEIGKFAQQINFELMLIIENVTPKLNKYKFMMMQINAWLAFYILLQFW